LSPHVSFIPWNKFTFLFLKLYNFYKRQL
jgi:hypothetical protein